MRSKWKLIRRFFCEHTYQRTRVIGGDELNANGLMRSEWTCVLCGKTKRSSHVDKID